MDHHCRGGGDLGCMVARLMSPRAIALAILLALFVFVLALGLSGGSRATTDADLEQLQAENEAALTAEQ